MGRSAKRWLSGPAAAVTLFLAPNALGLLADFAPRLSRRFSAWFYPWSLNLLPLVTLAFAFAVVLFLFVSRALGRRRTRAARLSISTGTRKTLPPLEVLLLQIGNLTFLAFAAILAIVVLGALSSALTGILHDPRLARFNFTASLLLATAVLAPALRPRVLRAQTWDRLVSFWLRRPLILAAAVAGFGAVAAAGDLGILKLRLAASQLPKIWLVALYALLLVGLGLCYLVARAGRARVHREDSRLPLIPNLIVARLIHLGILTLFLQGTFLTLLGHLPPG